MTTNNSTQNVQAIATRAKKASFSLRKAGTQLKNDALESIAIALEKHGQDIVQANKSDVDRERAKGMSESLLDRLSLNEERIADIAKSVRDVIALPDPVGEVIEGRSLANGMNLEHVRVPMGVIGMIYEARPNVTVDAAVLALKAGSSAILRGGGAAIESNKVLVRVMRSAVESVGLPADVITSVDEYGREGAVALMQARGLVDLVIPRGGAGLIQTVVENSRVPVIETGVGNCHVYVDKSADLNKARDIVLNSKTHRVGVCNAAETLLVHRDIADVFMPTILHTLAQAGVTLHADEQTCAYAPNDAVVMKVEEADWDTEYLALDMAVKVVDSLEDAVEHIRAHSTGHTEAIVAQDVTRIDNFIDSVDCAAVMVNASTRFTDGGQFGLGAEIGISTQKLHARGPMGLTEMTSSMWIGRGDGHIRA